MINLCETEVLFEMDYNLSDFSMILREDIEKTSILVQEVTEDFLQRVAMAAERDDLQEICFLCKADARRVWLKGCVVADLLDAMVQMIDREVGNGSEVEAIHGSGSEARSRGAAAST